MFQRIKPIIWLLLTLVLGFMLGVSSTRFMFNNRVKALRGQERGKGFINLHHNILGIRPEQTEVVDPILEFYFDKLEEHRKSTRIIIDSMHQELRPHLDEKQNTRLDTMKMRARRGPRRMGPGRGPFGMP